MANYDYPTDDQLGFCEACKGNGCEHCETEPEPVFDVFTASGRPFQGGYCVRVSGELAVKEFCERREPEYGPMYVKQIGGDVSVFVDGHLRVGTYPLATNDAIARAVAAHTTEASA